MTFFSMASALRISQLTCSRLLQTKCLQSSTCMSSTKAAKGMQEYWDKNRRLNRPLSPHLSIYKWQITSMLSITNRLTGAVLTGAMYLGPIIYLCGTKDFSAYMAQLQSWGPVGVGAIAFTKFSLAFSFSYHLLSGFRHLAWDNAMGYKLDQVYRSGMALLVLTFLLTAALMYI